MEEALFLTRFGSHVTLIHRNKNLRASKIMSERARHHAKISFLLDTIVEEAKGEHGLESLVLRDAASGAVRDFPCDALFVAIGHDPNTAIFAGQIALDQQKYILSHDGVRTDVPGVFVGGDVYDVRYKQAITAAGMGCKAALEAEKYLEGLEAGDDPASAQAESLVAFARA